VRSYKEQCPLARALDVIGDRWAMLVVRELMLGPRRYTDLAGGLPGIGTNILADRLTDLQRTGVITRLSVPPPTPAVVYRLTEAGQALWPAIRALGAWGAAHGRPASAADALRPGWVLLHAMGRPCALRRDELCELAVAGDTFWLRGGRAGLVIETAARRAADARITLDRPGRAPQRPGARRPKAIRRRRWRSPGREEGDRVPRRSAPPRLCSSGARLSRPATTGE
jgi:DNA-binding HxlR family transcriptional regulator